MLKTCSVIAGLECYASIRKQRHGHRHADGHALSINAKGIICIRLWMQMMNHFMQHVLGFHAGVHLFHAGVQSFHAGVHLFHADVHLFHADVHLFHAGVQSFHAGVHLFHAGVQSFHAGVHLFHAGVQSFHAGVIVKERMNNTRELGRISRLRWPNTMGELIVRMILSW